MGSRNDRRQNDSLEGDIFQQRSRQKEQEQDLDEFRRLERDSSQENEILEPWVTSPRISTVLSSAIPNVAYSQVIFLKKWIFPSRYGTSRGKDQRYQYDHILPDGLVKR